MTRDQTDRTNTAVPTLRELTDLHGRVAVVTEAASGIGHASAARLTEAGAVLYRADLSYSADRGAGQVAFERQPVDVHLDVTDADGVAALADHIATRHGRLDMWVNAAGIFPRNDVLDIPLEEWRQVLAVNLDGTMIAAQCAARAMLATRTPGVIVNLDSSVVHRVDGNAAHYRASKRASSP